MLYERWLRELWGGDYGAADEILTPEFVGHWPDREVEGRDALVELIRETRAMFSSLGSVSSSARWWTVTPSRRAGRASAASRTCGYWGTTCCACRMEDQRGTSTS